MATLRLGTRNSTLAWWQARHVRAALCAQHSGLVVELVPIVALGDKLVDRPLAEIGGKGLFIKELEIALLAGEIDLAVHSMKDVPADNDLPAGVQIAAIGKRGDPRDVFVSNEYDRLTAMPPKAVIGTSSPRRQCQSRHAHSGLRVKNLRGNVQTRLNKLDAGDYDAIILAAAGLQRLGLAARITEYIAPSFELTTGRVHAYTPPVPGIPAAGQGAIGVECRVDDAVTNRLLAPIDDRQTHLRVALERQVVAVLGGDCHSTLGVHCGLFYGEDGISEWLDLQASVGAHDGRDLVCARCFGPAAWCTRTAGGANIFVVDVVDQLLKQGAGRFLPALPAGATLDDLLLIDGAFRLPPAQSHA